MLAHEFIRQMIHANAAAIETLKETNERYKNIIAEWLFDSLNASEPPIGYQGYYFDHSQDDMRVCFESISQIIDEEIA